MDSSHRYIYRFNTVHSSFQCIYTEIMIVLGIFESAVERRSSAMGMPMSMES